MLLSDMLLLFSNDNNTTGSAGMFPPVLARLCQSLDWSWIKAVVVKEIKRLVCEIIIQTTIKTDAGLCFSVHICTLWVMLWWHT